MILTTPIRRTRFYGRAELAGGTLVVHADDAFDLEMILSTKGRHSAG
jgi:hypothetical protein